MKQIIKRILREQIQSPDYLEKVSRILEPPYFHLMEEHYGIIDPGDQLKVLKFIYGDDIRIDLFLNGERIFDSNRKKIYYEDRTGYWEKNEYDSNGNEIYSEDRTGFWYKREWDRNGNNIYFENIDGYWRKSEYDSVGNCIYSENSYGEIIDNR